MLYITYAVEEASLN